VIDPTEPPEVQIDRQARIIDALVRRAERGRELGGSAYSLFQSAISLQAAVWEKTKDLERALDTLGRASNELELAYQSHERLQKNLADAMETMEGGFALFSDDRLLACNDLFQRLLPDIAAHIQPSLHFADYLEAVAGSSHVLRDAEGAPALQPAGAGQGIDLRYTSQLLALRNDRWFQMSWRRTGSGNLAVLQTEVTDIVRENRRQKDLLIDQNTQYLHAAFDHMALGICTFSSAGELLVHNDRFRDLLGLPMPLLKKGAGFQRIVEYIGRFEVIEGPRARPSLRSWARTLGRGRAVQERLRRGDGACLDIHIHRMPNEGFIVSVTDVTIETDAADARQRLNETLERRVAERTAELTEANWRLKLQSEEQARTEEALRLAKEAAETAHRSKTRFLAAASHDLLQPINAAKLYISTLAETVIDPPVRATVDRLGRSFASIETLLHALLDISRLDSAGPEFNVTCLPLSDILRAVEEDFSPLAAEKGIRLTIVPTRAWVTSDHRYLLRCVQNLVANAIQYTDEGRVLVGCRRSGDALRVEVRDTGIGVSPVDQARIFNEFTRLNVGRAGRGVGLGLSIVERACRHLGHPLGLRSEPGRGSVFSIELPLTQVAGPSLPEPAVAAQAPGGLDLIAMVVENDADVLYAATQKLDSWGASVLAASSTAEALALMTEIGTPPDIILADYHLDGDDSGVRTIRALRAAAGVEIPAIIITADRSKAILREGAELSFTVLTKPVQLARLRALIDWKTRSEAV
jgi:two-component system, sensor histidine kinase